MHLTVYIPIKINIGSLKGKNTCRAFVLRCVVNIGKQEGERIGIQS